MICSLSAKVKAEIMEQGSGERLWSKLPFIIGHLSPMNVLPLDPGFLLYSHQMKSSR